MYAHNNYKRETYCKILRTIWTINDYVYIYISDIQYNCTIIACSVKISWFLFSCEMETFKHLAFLPSHIFTLSNCNKSNLNQVILIYDYKNLIFYSCAALIYIWYKEKKKWYLQKRILLMNIYFSKRIHNSCNSWCKLWYYRPTLDLRTLQNISWRVNLNDPRKYDPARCFRVFIICYKNVNQCV